ncbi:DNA starvation/stationary phase protection protein [Acrocarpospora phusangensis]|uniref:DNA starvation/stationary phase protection protein n=1 Tax=Acrocarpospora phusangensis TaxID=1070424 RepID=A0A919Q615_9ACTN|nr:DNA starvation/stationary phase protection protein [Acrocarpospora phusangensis]GIH23054.1 DNA starvation/stationary phase protection protein [Acrocarpospora phusangensis]
MAPITSLLTAENKKITGNALQGALVDLIDLALIGKQAHWNLTGRFFRPIHLQLDDIVKLARKKADSVAERAVAIGVNPDGRASTIVHDSQLSHMDAGPIEDGKVIAVMTDILESIIRRMRERIDATERADPVSQDLLIGLTRDLEMHHWMIQAQR